MDIEQILGSIYSIPFSAEAKLKAHISEISAPKNTTILKAGKVEKHIFFIKKGVVRAYSKHENGEITFWFGEEGETILSMKSYVEDKNGYENIELLEDCILYQIDTDDLKGLYEEDIDIANWGRKLAEKELLKIERRFISRQLLSAKERYDELMNTLPSLLLRVPLKHIASYLGITQVSLSRIRKEK